MNLIKTILLADDDSDDAGMFCEALANIDSHITCYTVENGKEALDFLMSKAEEKPQMIFLDINMPVMSGWECLLKLKNCAEFQEIPVVIYSTSSLDKDVEKAFELGACCFITKPVRFDDLKMLLEAIVKNPIDQLSRVAARFSGRSAYFALSKAISHKG